MRVRLKQARNTAVSPQGMKIFVVVKDHLAEISAKSYGDLALRESIAPENLMMLVTS